MNIDYEAITAEVILTTLEDGIYTVTTLDLDMAAMIDYAEILTRNSSSLSLSAQSVNSRIEFSELHILMYIAALLAAFTIFTLFCNKTRKMRATPDS